MTEQNSSLPLAQIIEICPQLTEQAIVNLVNGITPIEGAVSELKKQSNNFVSQILSQISGAKARQQNLVNEHVFETLDILKLYVINNEKRHQCTDKALGEICQGIGKIADKLKTQHGHIAELQQLQRDAQQQLDALQAQVRQHESYIFASTEMENALSGWQAGKLGMFTPEQALMIVCNRLYWGYFGTWLRLTKTDVKWQKQGSQMLETLENECWIILNQKTNRRPYELVGQERLIQQLSADDETLKDVLHFISQDSINPLSKITHLANQQDISLSHSELDIPFVFSNYGIVKNAIHPLTETLP